MLLMRETEAPLQFLALHGPGHGREQSRNFPGDFPGGRGLNPSQRYRYTECHHYGAGDLGELRRATFAARHISTPRFVARPPFSINSNGLGGKCTAPGGQVRVQALRRWSLPHATVPSTAPAQLCEPDRGSNRCLETASRLPWKVSPSVLRVGLLAQCQPAVPCSGLNFCDAVMLLGDSTGVD
jgi:hypothetical protein